MGRIIVIGLGPGDPGYLTQAATESLTRGPGVLVLRTGRHGCAGYLLENSVTFETLDALYDEARDYETLAALAADWLIKRAADIDLRYAVPDVRDSTVAALLNRGVTGLDIIPGVPVDAALMAYVPSDCLSIPASACVEGTLGARRPILIRELDNRLLVSELKLRLMELFPPEHQVYITEPESGAVLKKPLSEIDRQNSYDHTMCLMVPALPDFLSRDHHDFEDLVDIVRVLASPGGCPWDRQQTHQSVKGNLIEEAYEAVDAIDLNDSGALYDELGDVLLQVVLHADIANRHGDFGILDVTSAIVQKLIHRHPHVFGQSRADTAGEVVRNWEQIKGQDRGHQTVAESMRALTRSLPALLRAQKAQKRAARVGFDFADVKHAYTKVREEANEAEAALDSGDRVEEELGDLLFAVVNVIRLAGLDSERAMDLATRKFIDRFAALENIVISRGGKLESMTLGEMDALWDANKKKM